MARPKAGGSWQAKSPAELINVHTSEFGNTAGRVLDPFNKRVSC